MPPRRPMIDGFEGEVVLPDDGGYEAARRAYNARYDPRPAIILRPRDAADVARGIAHARAFGLPIAVRCGGHSSAGYSGGDHGAVLDLRAMNGIDVDRASGTVWVGGGALAGDVVRQAFALGLTVPFGDTASVGVSGITLGGGLGWLSRRYGMTIDSLIAAEVVTADGRHLTASEDEHQDLFWALRGGGGSFGVVTRLQYRLHTIGEVLFGTITLPGTRQVLTRLMPALLAAPDELTAMPTLWLPPPADPEGEGTGPAAPRELVLSLALCWSGAPADGERALAGLRGLGPNVEDTVTAMPYPSVYGEDPAEIETEAEVPEDTASDDGGWADRSLFLDALDDGVIEVIERHLASARSQVAIAHMRVLGGAISRIPAGATAFGWRGKAVMMAPIADVEDRSAPGRTDAWLDAFDADLRHHGEGAYPNFLGTPAPDAVRAAYRPETWTRLRAVKRAYDPGDLFRATYHIPPA